MNQTTIERIEAITYDLVEESFVEKKEARFPIDLKSIVEKSGLTVLAANFDDDQVEGVFKREQKEIIVKKTSPVSRKFFTVAHELGHYYLHQDKEKEIFHRKDSLLVAESDKEQEKEANWFASSLLMPRSYTITMFNVFKDVGLFAKYFGVSESAAFWRLKNLGLING